MKEDPFKGFEDFIKYCNNIYNDESNNSQNDGYYCGDIPGGFQDINPQFFLLIGEILGNVVAGKMPFNIQNVIGNWLELVGQAIETYNAQQQYMQSGPGRYYDIRNMNINNPFCSWNQTQTSTESNYDDASQFVNRGSSTASNTGSSSGTSNENSNNKYEAKIEELERNICRLEEEMKKMREELIKNRKK